MTDPFTFPSFIDITIIITGFLGKYWNCANFLKIQTRSTDGPFCTRTVLGTNSTSADGQIGDFKLFFP